MQRGFGMIPIPTLDGFLQLRERSHAGSALQFPLALATRQYKITLSGWRVRFDVARHAASVSVSKIYPLALPASDALQPNRVHDDGRAWRRALSTFSS